MLKIKKCVEKSKMCLKNLLRKIQTKNALNNSKLKKSRFHRNSLDITVRKVKSMQIFNFENYSSSDDKITHNLGVI